MSYKKYFKPTLHVKFGNDRRQEEKVMPKNRFLLLQVNFLNNRKFTLRQKYPGTTGN